MPHGTARCVVVWAVGLLLLACGNADTRGGRHAPNVKGATGALGATVPVARDAAAAVSSGGTPPSAAPAALRARGMIAIAARSFAMGSSTSPEEGPVHRVHVRAFAIDVTEVTVEDYAVCVEALACTATWRAPTCNAGHPERADHPINCVTWTQAEAYCRWQKKRLPSEEEWEYAARGAQALKYPWGDAEPVGRVCVRKWSAISGTCPVASYPTGKSSFGLFDMAGNVWEWTASGFSENYARPRSKTLRVLRGGGWRDIDLDYMSTTGRARVAPASSSDTYGFRCARTGK